MTDAPLRHIFTAAMVAGSFVCASPVLAGSFSMTSNWDLENTRRMVMDTVPKQATDIKIACQSMNAQVGNIRSRCGVDYRMP
jgi:hypothetical protein